MTNPSSPLNGQSQALDLLARAAGTVALKLGIGTKTVSGATNSGAWQGVATHEDDAAFAAADGVVAGAFLADETSTDLVDEGDIGVGRMTLDRRQYTAQRVTIVSATPTLDTSAYASGDSLHTTVISFASAVPVTGGTGRVRKLIVIDKDLQSIALELWLFSATVTPAAANAAHSISDADAALCVGVIPISTYYASALNSIGIASVDLPISCAATTLFGILVTRGSPTYTASGLTVALQIAVD